MCGSSASESAGNLNCVPPLALAAFFCFAHAHIIYYLGQIIASGGKVKREVSRRLALGYAAFNKLGKQGIWRDKFISRRTKLTLYKVIVRTVLLYCAETWPVAPADVNKLETAQMPCLRRICGDGSWGADCTS
jgi:hypothetical protein